MGRLRWRASLRILVQIGTVILLSTMYTNCGSFSSSGAVNASSITQSSSALSCDDATLKGIYQSGYYGFIRSHNCSLCHGTGGSGPPIGADDLSQAYSIFEVSPGNFLDSTINQNAVDPNHHGAGSPNNQSAISTISNTWTAAVAANCHMVSTETSGPLTYNFVLQDRVVNLTHGGTTYLSWDMSRDVTPASPVSAAGVTLSLRVDATQTNAIQQGYTISNVFISTTSSGIKISGAKVQINDVVYALGSTFVNSVADLPAPVDSFPLSRGNIFVPMTTSPTDTMSLRLGNIEIPSLAVNYQMTNSKPVAYSSPAKFSELIAPGGAMAVNCIQCHNPVFKNGNLNILAYNSVMQFVTPGLYSTHGDPESAMITLVLGGQTGGNVMPPKGIGNYNFYEPFISWFNSGAPNN